MKNHSRLGFLFLAYITMLGGLTTADAKPSLDLLHRAIGSEEEIVRYYPDAVKVQEGVFVVERGDRKRTFMLGEAGMRYRLEKTRRMYEVSAKNGILPTSKIGAK